ncbi:MAG: DUF2892 domain-containing protein [Alphaproteobacteria bacterium]|nr:DUF2892 domain-containing protein [Alphaproteobacteria bacterium]
MEANIGAFDRAARFVVGLAFLSLVVLLKDNARWIGLIGFIPLLTAMFRWCPVYSILGVKT